MSEAEDKFREVVRQAVINLWDSDKYESDLTATDYTDAIVGSLKLDSWLVTGEKIYEVRWSESYDFDDDCSKWYVYTQGLDGYLPDFIPEDDNE